MAREIVRKGTFVVLAALVVVGCGSSEVGTVEQDPSPLAAGTSQVSPGTIGTLSWETYDLRSEEMLATESRVFNQDEVTIENTSGIISKEIVLGDHFTLSVAGDSNGFALVGARDDAQAFSWDWFNVDGGGRATKLQEPGELAVTFVTTRSGSEISRMEFLTDVSVRLSDMSEVLANGDADDFDMEVTWRIKILKGSVIVWPTS